MIDRDRTTKRSALILPYIYIYIKKNTKKEMYNVLFFFYENIFYETIRTRSNIVITYMYIQV